MQSNQPNTPKELLKQIQLLYFAAIFGILIVLVVSVVLSRIVKPLVTDKSVLDILFFILAITLVILYPVLFMIYSKKLLFIKQSNTNLSEKLNGYRAALILYLAIFEAIIFAAMVIYSISGNTSFLVFTSAVLISLFLKRPGKSKIINELNLNSTEQLELN